MSAFDGAPTIERSDAWVVCGLCWVELAPPLYDLTAHYKTCTFVNASWLKFPLPGLPIRQEPLIDWMAA